MVATTAIYVVTLPVCGSHLRVLLFLPENLQRINTVLCLEYLTDTLGTLSRSLATPMEVRGEKANTVD